MSDLSISNVLSISISAANKGIGRYNTSNLAFFSDEDVGSTFPAEGYSLYKDPAEVADDWGATSKTYAAALAVFSQDPNILTGGGYLAIFKMKEVSNVTELLSIAVEREKSNVQFFGFLRIGILDQVDMLSTALIAQAENKIFFVLGKDAADIEIAGKLDLLRSNGYSHSRGLYYVGDSDTTDVDRIVFSAAYAGRALSTNFAGSLTTQTMHLKDLIGVTGDVRIDQAALVKSQAAGVDIYPNLQGIPKVFTSGSNVFFDDIYNEQWLIGALSVAGFNILAQVGNKIPQTEAGLSLLKNSYRSVLEQSILNGYVAPGVWTSPSTFGVPGDLQDNISQRGYYIYATPVSQQLQADREDRVAPAVQIAIKIAGAIHSSSVIININK